MASSSANKVLLSKERKCNPTPDKHLNMIPPDINILMKKPRDLYFVAFLDFLYPILNSVLKPHSHLILSFVKS